MFSLGGGDHQRGVFLIKIPVRFGRVRDGYDFRVSSEHIILCFYSFEQYYILYVTATLSISSRARSTAPPSLQKAGGAQAPLPHSVYILYPIL